MVVDFIKLLQTIMQLKRSVVSAYSLKILYCNFELIHRTAVLKAAQKKLDARVVQTGKVILVCNIRAKALKHNNDEFAKATKIYEKTLAAEQKKEQAGFNAEKKT